MENIIENKFSVWKSCCYFIFYSFIGFLLETAFGLWSKGVIESRQSFLFGPFCAIYGIGAFLMITFLSNLRNKPIKLFFASCLLGTLCEYSMSFFCEKIFHFKWWDYSGMALNINGRVCLYFTVMWGFLGLALIKFINPQFVKILDFLKSKIDIRVLKVSVFLVIGFLIFDSGITAIALKSFYAKLITDFDLDIKTSEYADFNIDNDLFSEEHMLFVYPNIQIAGTKYNNTSVASLYNLNKNYIVQVFSSDS